MSQAPPPLRPVAEPLPQSPTWEDFLRLLERQQAEQDAQEARFRVERAPFAAFFEINRQQARSRSAQLSRLDVENAGASILVELRAVLDRLTWKPELGEGEWERGIAKAGRLVGELVAARRKAVLEGEAE